MDRTGNQRIRDNPQTQLEGHPITNGLTKIHRRNWSRTAVGGSVGLALDGLLDLPTVRAATQKLKLANVSEFTTTCNFCSCGCGMIAAVREGKLIAMEGDYDHIVNRGSLCVKSISMFATHTSANRLKTPRYRAPGSDHGRTPPRTTQSRGGAEDSKNARRNLDRLREGRRQRRSGQSDGRDRLHGRRAEHERGVRDPFSTRSG
jgi:hypothetical protein